LNAGLPYEGTGEDEKSYRFKALLLTPPVNPYPKESGVISAPARDFDFLFDGIEKGLRTIGQYDKW
jgi:hypothetical protein